MSKTVSKICYLIFGFVSYFDIRISDLFSASICEKNAVVENKERPLQNIQFCSSSRKVKILTTGIYLDILRIKI